MTIIKLDKLAINSNCFPIPILFTVIFLFSFTTFAFASEKQTIRVGVYENPPKIGMNNDGAIVGFWAELIEHIAEAENWKTEYVYSKWNRGLRNLRENKIDIMLDVAFTPERAQDYDFSRVPVMTSWSRVYVRSGDKRIKSIEDLSGKRIAGLLGSVNIEGPDGIKRLVQSFNLQCTIVEMHSYTEVFKALIDRSVDAVITNRNYGDNYTLNHPVKKTPIMIQPVSLMFAFPKGLEKSRYLASRIDFHMANITNDHSSYYYNLMTKYFGDNIANKNAARGAPKWFLYVIFGLVAMMLILAVIVIYARIQVKQKTVELCRLNDGLQKRIEDEINKRLESEQIIFEQQKFADMGQMISSISHQWRQPLNNIYLISQVLQEQWENGQSYGTFQNDFFEKQTNVIRHMSSTIDDFRGFFQSDKERVQFNVTDTVMNCLRIIHPELKHHNIKLNIACSCDGEKCAINLEEPSVACDSIYISTVGLPGELKQVILNILSNAKDAIIDTGDTERVMSIDITQKLDDISIVIEDTGGGIPEDIIPKIFDPYFSTKDEGKGLGIGLYMCKTILQKHLNGDIIFENTENGAKFVITLKKTTV